LAFSEDGRTLVTCSSEPGAEVALWRVADGKKLQAFPALRPEGSAGTSFALAANLSVAAYASEDDQHRGRVVVIDLVTGKTRWRLPTLDDVATAVALSPDGRFLATGEGYSGSNLRLWDVDTGQELSRPILGHHFWVSSLAFFSDGKTLASTSADQTVRLWDLSDPNHVRAVGVMRGHQFEVWRLALAPDQRTLVTGSKEGEVLVWDAKAAREREHAQHLMIANVKQFGFAQDGRAVLTLDPDGRLTSRALWTPAESQPWLVGDADPQARSGICFSRDGRWLALGLTNGFTQVWDLQARALVHELRTSLQNAEPVGFRAQGQHLIIRQWQPRRLEEWDLASGKPIQSWSVPSGGSDFSISGMGPDIALMLLGPGVATDLHLAIWNPLAEAASPDGQFFALASDLGYIKVWEATSLRETATLSGFLLRANSVAFSPNGKRLLAGANGREAIKIWDLLTLPAEGSLFWGTQMSPDGNAVGSVNRTALHLWTAPSMAEIEAAEAKEKGEVR